jgi:hypothetical protein
MKELIKRVLMEETEDLEYINSYWKEMNNKLDSIIRRITTELPIINGNEYKQDPEYSKLKTIQYSDMDKWLSSNKSDSLIALADKITYMIRTGKSDGIKRMLEKISTGRVKSLTKPGSYESEFLGRGHFRWNNQAYRLTTKEIDRVKEYFKL